MIRSSQIGFSQIHHVATLVPGEAEPVFELPTGLDVGDGVYGALAGTAAARQLRDALPEVFALSQDVTAAGLEAMVADFVEIADYAGFVTLSEVCERQLTWT